jgi:hypothetical protein
LPVKRKMGGTGSVQLQEDHKIAVELKNGSIFVYSLKHRLQTAGFAPLTDVNFLKAAIWWTRTIYGGAKALFCPPMKRWTG